MRRISAGGLAVLLWATMSPATARGQEIPPSDAAVERAAASGTKPEPAAAQVKGKTEAAATQYVVEKKLAALDAASARAKQGKDKAAEERIKAMREVYLKRLELLGEWDKAVKARYAAEHPEVSPEAEAAELKSALERDRAALVKAAKEPLSLLPEVFRSSAATDAALAEMNEVIGKAQDAAEAAKKEVDDLSADAGRTKVASPLVADKADREGITRRIAAIGARASEADAALSVAPNAEARELARERLANLAWDGKIDSERLREVEARIDLDSRRAPLLDLKLEDRKVRLDLARATLAAFQARYKERVENQVAALKRASAAEGNRAAHTANPLERYRAHRAQDLLDQEALFKKRDSELKTKPAVALDDQKEKAEEAVGDIANLKRMVKGGHSSALVAQRLNTNYRRLASERASLVRNELAQVTAQLNQYEEELTRVELDDLNDFRGDRAARENLLSMLPARQKAEASALFDDLEGQQHAILLKRRKVLMDLSTRAEETQKQVLRRLALMDEQHAFIRTHMFWVRDQAPLGLASLDEGRREARDAARTVVGMAEGPWAWSRRGPYTPEFLLAAAGLVLSPWFLLRARKALRARLDPTQSGRPVLPV